MAQTLGYDEAVAVVRRILEDTAGKARAFATRSRGRPSLLSHRTWAELATIEALSSQRAQAALQRELRVEPWTSFGQARAAWRGLRDGLVGESPLVRRLLAEACASPVERWRAEAPQLEETLWRFLSARTRHLANSAALGLGEPSPYPTLIWHPGRREFLEARGEA
jgi:hypothetical protein